MNPTNATLRSSDSQFLAVVRIARSVRAYAEEHCIADLALRVYVEELGHLVDTIDGLKEDDLERSFSVIQEILADSVGDLVYAIGDCEDTLGDAELVSLVRYFIRVAQGASHVDPFMPSTNIICRILHSCSVLESMARTASNGYSTGQLRRMKYCRCSGVS